MDISRQFINNSTRVWLAILLLGVGGLFALLNIGRLEDPAFTIKTAVIVTHYPGASAQQVEEEVTLPLENAIQQLPSLDNVSSISSNGLSQITVNIASQYHSSELPQIWDELRRRVGDASRLFPPGVVPPFVNDDFGDVFGFFFAISGDSFTNPELVRYAEQLRRELVLVPGVGKVAIGGVIPQQINVDISLAKMAARGITLNQLAAILARLNVVSSAGEIRVGSESIRLHPTGEFQSIDELGDLLVSPHGASATTRLREIATLSRVRTGGMTKPISIASLRRSAFTRARRSSAEPLTRSTRSVARPISRACTRAWASRSSVVSARGAAFLAEPWMVAKLAGVLLLSGWHGFLAAQRKKIAAGTSKYSGKFWRMTNEVPFVLAIVMVLSVTTEWTFR